MLFPYVFSIVAFFETFPSDTKAVEFLLQRGILHGFAICVKCEKEMNLQELKSCFDGFILRCCKCKMKQSVRKGTFLEKSKLCARDFLLCLYFWSNDYTIAQLCTYIGLVKHTCVDYSNFLREISSWKFSQEDRELGGFGHIIQVDESVIYRAKYDRGHALFEPIKWVFGILDVTEGVGAVFFVPIGPQRRFLA
jgi:hypothetical protein